MKRALLLIVASLALAGCDATVQVGMTEPRTYITCELTEGNRFLMVRPTMYTFDETGIWEVDGPIETPVCEKSWACEVSGRYVRFTDYDDQMRTCPSGESKGMTRRTTTIIDRTTGTFTMEHVNCNEDGPVTGSGICVKDKKPERRKF